jgi:hypothetical protein
MRISTIACRQEAQAGLDDRIEPCRRWSIEHSADVIVRRDPRTLEQADKARQHYRRQVALLVRTQPYIARHEVVAHKGGTAINLFHRDMPRLTIDIDRISIWRGNSGWVP